MSTGMLLGSPEENLLANNGLHGPSNSSSQYVLVTPRKVDPNKTQQKDEVHSNVRRAAGLLNPDTQDFLELDIFIPSLSLAFEYHVRHYHINRMDFDNPLCRNNITIQPLNTLNRWKRSNDGMSSRNNLQCLRE